MDTESTTPPLAITAETVPLNAVEVSETVPVYAVFRRPPESRARTRTLVAVPAVCVASAVVPPLWVTENWVTAPKGVTDDDAVEDELEPTTFVATTVKV
jgi:hypothetical protein